MTQTVAAEMPRALTPRRSVHLSEEAARTLAEVMDLMGEDDPGRAVQVALVELAERQRFLALVAEHERRARLDPGA